MACHFIYGLSAYLNDTASPYTFYVSLSLSIYLTGSSLLLLNGLNHIFVGVLNSLNRLLTKECIFELKFLRPQTLLIYKYVLRV